MAKPVLALWRLSFDGTQGKVIYRYGKADADKVEMDYLEKASPGWRELIRKVYEVDPLTCPACGAEMKVIAFITNYAVIDKIIHHLGVTFTYERPPPAPQQEELY